ncbi:amino acid/amide ABC transporter substrate-binding protein, HAAT family [Loktanella fryxellensis]|uniref:Amino acid/amide ABC transporter substrate-binding protein, HAAT family n=1 Tax=Loktanella fryxellensis TaxID=245187 RepID=A0A1H8CFT8_9RHOB|nr:transporter substrate-binding protein [Loktanella fryxellensis]SEM92957.1 amino acid/amide ABC transporter substrate-binding protein, HAAT family [Loktanella fryxellensis]
MRRTIAIGILFSRSGAYARIGQACRTGALNAIAAINADPDRTITLAAVDRDPAGNVDLYAPLCAEILRNTPARHIVGCVTSSSRKEVIPTLEKCDGTLWYPVPYEGFEASDRVVYLHASPNQHLLPLLDWVIPTHGGRAYLVGSNYIWGWEMNRIARDRIMAADGQVLGERYLPVGSIDIDRMIEEIRATAPDFVLNSLIGPSSYAFLRAFAALGIADARFRPDRCPVLSCNLTECELPDIGSASEGLIAAGPYFRSPADSRFGSSHEAAAHRAVMTLACLLEQSPSAADDSIATLLATPAGRASGIDAQTHHMMQAALIAQVRDGGFVTSHDAGVRAGDPYLTGPRDARLRPPLRVVS